MYQLSVNTATYNILKSKAFWSIYFINHQLILPNVYFDNMNDYVNLYFTTIAVKIITILREKKLNHILSTKQLNAIESSLDQFMFSNQEIIDNNHYFLKSNQYSYVKLSIRYLNHKSTFILDVKFYNIN